MNESQGWKMERLDKVFVDRESYCNIDTERTNPCRGFLLACERDPKTYNEIDT